MNKDDFKLKISKILFSLYPFIYNFRGYSTTYKVIYKNTTGVIINDKIFNDLNSITSNYIINLASINPSNMKIENNFDVTEQEIKDKNEIYRFQLFIHNFINIIKYQYEKNKSSFDIIYKIYYTYLLNRSIINSFKQQFKSDKSDTGIAIIMNELYLFDSKVKEYNTERNNIINAIIENEELLSNSLYENDNNSPPLYTFNDFIDYLSYIYKELNKELEIFSINFSSQIKLFNESLSGKETRKVSGVQYKLDKDIVEGLKGFDVENIRKTQDIKSIYSKAQSVINNYINSTSLEDNIRYNKVNNLTDKEKIYLKLTLATFVHLLDTNKGRWKSDIEKSGEYRVELQKLQYDFTNILQILDYTKVEVKADYYEVKDIYDRLKKISKLILNKNRIPKEDFDLINNFDQIIDELSNDPRFKDDKNFENEIKKVKNLYNKLNSGSNPIINKEKLKDVEIIRKDTIYFDTNIIVFKIILKYLVMFGVLLLLIVVLLSSVSLFVLIWDVINYFIKSFINPNLTKAFTIDYLTKNMVYCNKNNYKDDRYLIFSVQSQNLSIFTLSAYILYLLLALLIFYLMHVLYATSTRKILKGSIYDIDNEGGIIIIFIIILGYSVTHLLLYTYLFKPFVYNQYKDYEQREIDVEKLLEKYILIKSKSSSSTEIIVDNNFFNILFDSTRIDELNTLFLIGIKDKNSSGCLEQKLIIYDIYTYLKEYISFDEKTQNNFKEYCTNDINNKPTIEGSNKKTTFLSMLNNSEVRMIKKYHEEMDFYQNIPDDSIEYYNELNNSLNKKLKSINEKIITYNKTLVPFFTTILYIFGVFFFTIGLFYMVINYVIMGDAKMSDENKFNYYFVYTLFIIKTQIYDKIINWLNK